tara:strand:+ start:1556 stop:2401 length:846 start_codon:yes stop_codon:yes gene_type:complete
MKNSLSIIIAHFKPDDLFINPLLKTIETINNQKLDYSIEVIISDDGSNYSKYIMEHYSKKINIQDDEDSIYILEKKQLDTFLKSININYDIITKWVYLPKSKPRMSKAMVANYSVKESSNENLLFLDDDNYFISENSIEGLIKLFDSYDLIVGQIKDNNNKLRHFSSSKVQGTTIGIKKYLFNQIKGFGDWTKDFSCGVDSDLWIKLYNYYSDIREYNACYTDKISTYDSCSKRWKKFSYLFRDFILKKEFNKRFNCKNYKSKKYNLSRNKILWMDNLIEI